MFSPEDFELPLERQLRLRGIQKEITECTDVDALKEQLKACAEQLMKYQHLLGVTLQKQLQQEIKKLMPEAS